MPASWPDTLALVTALKDFSITAALWLVLIGGALGKWVWGYHYDGAIKRLDACEAHNRWLQAQLLSAVEMTDRIVGLAERRRRS